MNENISVKEAIRSRRSIRKFKQDPVPKDLIDGLLESARMAPSASNSQPWRFMVVTDIKQLQVLAELGGNQKQLKEAPLIIICCGDLNSMKEDSLNKQRKELLDEGVYEDIGVDLEWFKSRTPEETSLLHQINKIQANLFIAVEHMVLSAVSLGLGTCWTGAFDRERLQKVFKLPEHILPLILLPAGYPAQAPRERPRLSLDEITLEPPREILTFKPK